MLSLKNISKSFGSLVVINDLSLDVSAGQVLGVIGPNGAGKTTMFSIIAGQVHPEQGKVFFEGQNISGMTPYRRCRKGLGRTFQVPRPFLGMSVFENARVAANYGGGLKGREADATAFEAMEMTGLLSRANVPCANLSLLDRKRLELTRALASVPKMLLLDEIGGGLTDHEIFDLIDILKRIRERGIAIVWIEHIVHALTSFVDSLVVINFGKKLAEGRPREVMALPEVHEIYMGLDEAADA